MNQGSDRTCRSSRLLSIVTQVSTFVLLSLFTSAQVQGTAYSFRSEPERYYYSLPGNAEVIPCEAVETKDDGTENVVSVTVIRNSRPVNPDRPPSRLAVRSDRGRYTGIVIIAINREDSGTTFQCVVDVNGERVLSSQVTTLFVGDGLPLAPVSNPGQIGETLTTLTIDWGEAPVPVNAPLQGYTISVIPLQGEDRTPLEIDTRDNDTTIQLFNLTPGGRYEITVFGRNSNGRGAASGVLVGSTVAPVPPPPPTQVEGTLEVFGTSSSITVTWMQPELNYETMTPVMNFVILYGLSETDIASYKTVTTSNNLTNTFIISGFTVGGSYLVGVAAVNSAGRSQVTFVNETFEVESQGFVTDRTVHRHLQLSIIITTSVVGVSLLFLSIIIVTLLVVIYVVRIKNRQMAVVLNHQNGGGAAKSDQRLNDLSLSSNGSGKELSMSISIKQSQKHSNGNGQIKNGKYSIA